MIQCFIFGSAGRIGSMLVEKLGQYPEFYTVTPVESGVDADIPAIPMVRTENRVFLFDCAWEDAHEADNLAIVHDLLHNWHNCVEAIFIPSSMHVGGDHQYGRMKLIVEQLANFYGREPEAARIVVDRIGYFPGTHGVLDLGDPFIDKLVSPQELFERIMSRMDPDFSRRILLT